MRILLPLLLLCAAAAARPPAAAIREYLEVAAEASPDAAAENPWDITGALGVTFTSGNPETTNVTIGLDAAREWVEKKLKLKLRYLGIYNEAEGIVTVNEHIVTERLDRALNEISSLFQTLLLEYDEVEQVDLRLQFTLGYRRQLMDKEKFKLWGDAGAGVVNTDFATGVTQTEAILHLAVEFEWQLTDQLKYTQKVFFFPSLSESGEFRLVSESVFVTPISDRMDLRIGILDQYNSNPQPGIKKNDVNSILALSFRFTKKKKAA